jgi:hypothetical protein
MEKYFYFLWEEFYRLKWEDCIYAHILL